MLNTTTINDTTTDDTQPSFQGELALPDFPEEKGRRAYELLRVVATFEPDDHDMEKVQSSHHHYVQLPEPEYNFPEDDGEFWGESLAGIACEIANNVGGDVPRKTFDKICVTFVQKVAQIAIQQATQEATQKAVQEATQKAARQWVTELVEKAASAK